MTPRRGRIEGAPGGSRAVAAVTSRQLVLPLFIPATTGGDTEPQPPARRKRPAGGRGEPGQGRRGDTQLAAPTARGARRATVQRRATVAPDAPVSSVHPDVRRTLAIVAEIMMAQHLREVAASTPKDGTMSGNAKGHARGNERDPESPPCRRGQRPMAKSTRAAHAPRTPRPATDPGRAA